MGKPKHINHDAFSIFTNEAIYWIGFLYADGSIRGNEVNLALSIEDLEHLQKFRSFLSSEHKLQTYDRVCKLSFSSTTIVEKLSEHGIVNRKCHICKPPKVLENNPHFWRGVVDGDGTINTAGAVGLTGTYDTCKAFSLFMGDKREPIPYKKSFYVWSLKTKTPKVLYNQGFVQLDRKAVKATVRIDRRFKSES